MYFLYLAVNGLKVYPQILEQRVAGLLENWVEWFGVCELATYT